MNRITKWIDKNWLDIMGAIMFVVVWMSVTFWDLS